MFLKIVYFHIGFLKFIFPTEVEDHRSVMELFSRVKELFMSRLAEQ